MTRELHRHYYPGGISVVVVINSDPAEEFFSDIFEVAFLRTEESWWNRENAERMLPEERAEIEAKAEQWMWNWIVWSIDPNHERPKEQSEKYAAKVYKDWHHKWQCK